VSVTIVTGAASGMGEATLALLRARGKTAIGWDRAFADPVELTDAAAVGAAFERAVAEHGRVEGLVNAAGVWTTGALGSVPLAEWERTLAVNLTALFLTCSRALPHMAEHGGGAIVNVASLAALRAPKVPSAAYAASKGGVVAFTRAVAAEGGPLSVRCNAVSPGAIETPMLTNTVDAGTLARYGEQAALGRLGAAGEVAEAIVFLLSDAASFGNGANLEVTGG
jgi:NAD(P)-dependent dehydrogenase (short-subunit alcohol dehydrogenase family)